MSKNIVLLVGASGSGKSTIASELTNRYGLKQVKSYTTRAPRDESDYHIFVTEEEFAKLKNIVAYTHYAGNEYCATADQIDENDVYIIDPKGVSEFRKLYKGNKNIVVVGIEVDDDELKRRLKQRGESDSGIRLRRFFDLLAFRNMNNICDYMLTSPTVNEAVEFIYNTFFNEFSEQEAV